MERVGITVDFIPQKRTLLAKSTVHTVCMIKMLCLVVVNVAIGSGIYYDWCDECYSVYVSNSEN